MSISAAKKYFSILIAIVITLIFFSIKFYYSTDSHEVFIASFKLNNKNSITTHEGVDSLWHRGVAHSANLVKFIEPTVVDKNLLSAVNVFNIDSSPIGRIRMHIDSSYHDVLYAKEGGGDSVYKYKILNIPCSTTLFIQSYLPLNSINIGRYEGFFSKTWVRIGDLKLIGRSASTYTYKFHCPTEVLDSDKTTRYYLINFFFDPVNVDIVNAISPIIGMYSELSELKDKKLERVTIQESNKFSLQSNENKICNAVPTGIQCTATGASSATFFRDLKFNNFEQGLWFGGVIFSKNYIISRQIFSASTVVKSELKYHNQVFCLVILAFSFLIIRLYLNWIKPKKAIFRDYRFDYFYSVLIFICISYVLLFGLIDILLGIILLFLISFLRPGNVYIWSSVIIITLCSFFNFIELKINKQLSWILFIYLLIIFFDSLRMFRAGVQHINKSIYNCIFSTYLIIFFLNENFSGKKILNNLMDFYLLMFSIVILVFLKSLFTRIFKLELSFDAMLKVAFIVFSIATAVAIFSAFIVPSKISELMGCVLFFLMLHMWISSKYAPNKI